MIRKVIVLAAVTAAFVLPHPTHASDFRPILVDADRTDWDGSTAIHVDPTGDHGSAPADIGEIFLANDDDFVYIRFELSPLVGIQTLASPFRIHIDVDNNQNTGYGIQLIGSEIMVEFSPGGSGMDLYEQTSSNFRALDLGHGFFDTYQGPTVAATSYEVRLRRGVVLPIMGGPVFTGSDVRVAFEVLNGSGVASEIAPNDGAGILYIFASGGPVAPPDNDLAKLDPEHIRLMCYNTHNGEIFAGESARGTRILQAIQPDVIGFQELWNFSASDVINKLNVDLPISGGGSWQAIKGAGGVITASRFALAQDTSVPAVDLGTIIDLPDIDYDRDLYLFNTHFKCCGSIGSSEDIQRQNEADAVSGWTRELKLPGPDELPEKTPIIHMGDLNLVGGPQPLITLLTGDIVNNGSFGPDHGPDWDGSDLQASLPIHTDGLAAYTWRNDFSSFGPGKLDYIIFTDAVVELGNSFVLNTLDMSPSKLSALGLVANDTEQASDHLPFVQDLRPTGGLVDVPGQPAVLSGLSLHASPNPFHSRTRISFRLPAATQLKVVTYDVSSKRVRLVGDRVFAAGEQVLEWDGRDDRGRSVPAGLYFLRLEQEPGRAGASSNVIKLILTR